MTGACIPSAIASDMTYVLTASRAADFSAVSNSWIVDSIGLKLISSEYFILASSLNDDDHVVFAYFKNLIIAVSFLRVE